jgi:hypothetical protein
VRGHTLGSLRPQDIGVIGPMARSAADLDADHARARVSRRSDALQQAHMLVDGQVRAYDDALFWAGLPGVAYLPSTVIPPALEPRVCRWACRSSGPPSQT